MAAVASINSELELITWNLHIHSADPLNSEHDILRETHADNEKQRTWLGRVSKDLMLFAHCQRQIVIPDFQ